MGLDFDNPNLFPGMTPGERALASALAKQGEDVARTVERLHGFLNDLTKSGFTMPGIVQQQPPLRPWEDNMPVPLSVDERGYLNGRTRRIEGPEFVLNISGGQSIGDPGAWCGTRAERSVLDAGSFLILGLDDPSRLAAEVIRIDISEDGNTWLIGQTGVFAATVGVLANLSVILSPFKYARVVSAVPVGAAGRSFRFRTFAT